MRVRSKENKEGMTHSTRGQRKGSVLMFTVVVMVVLILLGLSVVSLSSTRLVAAANYADRLKALNLAEAGSDYAYAWITTRSSPPAGTEPFDPFNGPLQFESGTATVSIDPDDNNIRNIIKRYYVESTGQVQRRKRTAKVRLYVATQSFGDYAYFTNHELGYSSGSTVWFIGRDHIDGRAHSNDRFHIYWWANNPPDPIFLAPVTTSNNSIDWYQNNAPTTDADWAQVFLNGRSGLTTGVDPVPLPAGTDDQKMAAWGASSGFPTPGSTPDVYLRASQYNGGGIYIKGDVETMTSSVELGREVFRLNQITQDRSGTTHDDSQNVTITIDWENGSVSMQKTKTTWTQSGSRWSSSTTTTVEAQNPAPNGVIYVDGTVKSLSGVFKGAMTLATSPQDDVTITGNLTAYNNPRDNPASTDTLGIVAQNVPINVPSSNRWRNGTTQGVEIDATMLAGIQSDSGGIYNVGWNRMVVQGTIRVLGGLIQAQRGEMGLFSGTTIVSGYAKDYKYDTRLLDNPPPYFPTTGKLKKAGWQQL